MATAQEINVTHTHQISDAEYDRRLQTALKTLGIQPEPKQLQGALRNPENVIEGEFVEVKDDWGRVLSTNQAPLPGVRPATAAPR